MNVAQYTTQSLVNWMWIRQTNISVNDPTSQHPSPKPAANPLGALRRWIDRLEVRDPMLAHRLCRLIPAQCPFERDVKFAGIKLFHIPPLCKFNPVYEEVVGLRFRALCYLADECGEDITPYC